MVFVVAVSRCVCLLDMLFEIDGWIGERVNRIVLCVKADDPEKAHVWVPACRMCMLHLEKKKRPMPQIYSIGLRARVGKEKKTMNKTKKERRLKTASKELRQQNFAKSMDLFLAFCFFGFCARACCVHGPRA